MNGETRSRERSPNYPALGLPAAIEAVMKLWQAEKRTPVPPVVAARAIGYGSLNGTARTAIASLRQYGLLDGTDGTLALSDIAVNIAVHQVGSTEWGQAVKEAAGKPALFNELGESHADASDSALRAYLITKRKFSADGAARVIAALRETATLVKRIDDGYDRAPAISDQAYGEQMAMPQSAAQQQTMVPQQVTGFISGLLGPGRRVEVRFFGGEPEPSHIQKLEAILKAQREAMSD